MRGEINIFAFFFVLLSKKEKRKGEERKEKKKQKEKKEEKKTKERQETKEILFNCPKKNVN